MDKIDLVFGVLVLAGALLVWFYFKSRAAKQNTLNQIWREFAQFNALKELDRDPSDHGVMLAFHGKNQGMVFVLECFATEGTPVQVGKLELSRGEDNRIFTRMRLTLPGVPGGLRVYSETPWSKLGKAVGMQDITTGDPEFDRNFVVKGNDPQVVVDYLTPSRRIALLGHASRMKGLELREEGLVLMHSGQIESLQELGQLFSQLGSLAGALK
jgi:hypothetical protein